MNLLRKGNFAIQRKEGFISTNANTQLCTKLQSVGDLPTQQMGSSQEAQNPTAL